MKREKWIDFARFFGILFVLMMHAGIKIPIISQFGGMFYVPVFFVTAGYTIGIKQENFLAFVMRKAGRFLIPYFLYHFFLVVFFLIRGSLQGHSLIGIFYARYSIYPLGTPGNTVLLDLLNSPMWFLPALFISEVLFEAIRRFAAHKIPVFLLLETLCVFAGLSFVYLCPILLPWSLDCAGLFQLFICAGYLARKYKLLERFKQKKGFIQLGIVSFSSFFLFVFYQWNGAANLSVGDFGKYVIAGLIQGLLSSLLLAVLCEKSAKLIENGGKAAVCVDIGFFCIARSSMTIMCLHAFVFAILEGFGAGFKVLISIGSLALLDLLVRSMVDAGRKRNHI